MPIYPIRGNQNFGSIKESVITSRRINKSLEYRYGQVVPILKYAKGSVTFTSSGGKGAYTFVDLETNQFVKLPSTAVITDIYVKSTSSIDFPPPINATIRLTSEPNVSGTAVTDTFINLDLTYGKRTNVLVRRVSGECYLTIVTSIPSGSASMTVTYYDAL